MNRSPAAITIVGLSKTFRRGFWGTPVPALRDVELIVLRGETFGLLGVNGAGKSTTFKILAGLIHPSSGQVQVWDRPVHDLDVRRLVGYLPDQPVLYDYLTAEEQLMLCARLGGLSGPALRKRVGALLDLVALTHVRDRRLRSFSKGMLQRVGIAQAMVHDPALLLLDEPMSGLDPVARGEVGAVLLQLKRQGVTLLFSSHLLRDIELLSDRVGILVNGRMKAVGSVPELLGETLSHAEHPHSCFSRYAQDGEGCTV